MVQTTPESGLTKSIQYTASNGGSVLSTGVVGFIYIPFSATITSNTLLADETGSIVVDIWKVPYGAFPPTNVNSICASDLPTISSAQNSQDTTLTGWTKSVNFGDILAFNINSVTSIKTINIVLGITMT